MALFNTNIGGSGNLFELLAGYTVVWNEYGSSTFEVNEGDIVVGGVRTASTPNGDVTAVSSELELVSDPSTTGVGHDYGIWKAVSTGTATISFTTNVQTCLCVLRKTV